MITLVVTLRVAAVSLLSVVLAAAGLLPRTGTASGGVELSRDLTHWTTDLDEPMFLPDLAWSPGDVRTTTFFVRNDTERTADVHVVLTRRPSDPPRADDWVRIDVAAAGGPVQTVAPGETRHQVTVPDLAPGANAPVRVRATLSADAPDGTEVDGDLLDFRATLDDPHAPGTGADRGGFASRAYLQLAPLFLGLAMIGAVVIAGRRRRGAV